MAAELAVVGFMMEEVYLDLLTTVALPSDPFVAKVLCSNKTMIQNTLR